MSTWIRSCFAQCSQTFSNMPRPPMPSSKAPTNQSERRFHPISAPTEWIESYRPGGLHPIHLGDTLDAGRYNILRKLGFGSFSTVWLARDARESQYVAIKVSVARASETNSELGIFEHLAPHRHQPDARYVMELKHSFEHEGPNGRHLCLVFPVMGPSACTMEVKFRTDSTFPGRYPLWIAKSMLKQLLLGLSFLHQNGVIHYDVQPGNILFSLPNIHSLPESHFRTDITQPQTISDPVKRIDGKVDLWSPRYTVIPQPLTSLATVEAGFMIQISDMGAACLTTTANSTTPITPIALRAPELILSKPWDMSIDIWSFGCLLFEFLTGTPLFAIGTYGLSAEDIDDDHLRLLISVVGPLPTDLRAQWSRYSLHYDDEGNEVKRPEDDEISGDELDPPEENYEILPLEMFLKREAPPEMDTREVEAVGMLLREILQYDPTKRPTAADLLKNPWFKGIAEST